MNPWLEHDDAWHDFHHTLVVNASHMLVPQVRPRYIIRLGCTYYRERIRIPHSDEFHEDLQKTLCLEIRHLPDRELVTVVEFLDRLNKAPVENRDQYLKRRKEILEGNTHLIEIDLLRGGQRLPMKNDHYCDYCVLMSHRQHRPSVFYWPIRLRERLPIVPIPMREPDADVELDLQMLLHRVYDSGCYDDYIYDTPPDPPLAADDAEWAKQFLPAPPPG
jgi:hypothetical protein